VDARTSGIAKLFDRVSTAYDGSGVPWFTPIARRLVEEVGPRSGQRALDIGCGRGAALFALAEAVGPDGAVTGIDLAPGMVEAVRADAAARGLSNVDIRLMDAGRPELPGGFDVVVASMVVFFLPEPVAALRAWRGLLVPGGRLGITTQGPRDPGWRALDEIFEPFLPPVIREARTGPAARRFVTDEAVRETLAEAGYRSIRTSTVDFEAVFDGPGQWREWSRSHGGRVMWESVPHAELTGLLAAAGRHLEGLRGLDGRIHLGQRIRVTIGENTAAPSSALPDLPDHPHGA
jgi:ubiquinone/menaquinone biosynthesis C-methylase UbiE